MARSVPTVMQLFLDRLQPRARTVDVLNELDPKKIPRMAAAVLQRAGVPLIGAPELVEFARTKVIQDIELMLDLRDAERTTAPSRKAGRPRSSFDRDAMFVVAFRKFADQGLKPAEARSAAARLLGTKANIVDKGVRRFTKRVDFLKQHARPDELRRADEQLLAVSRALLERCVEER